ncbi:MAG: serine/threonine protein kinase [Lentisphaerae bacterium]|nr:serine/threonine protein kinase [Lentisphaerota bacterium]
MVHQAKRILAPGTQIAGYRIEAELGQGAMAVVYRARQLNLDRPVALKVLSDDLAADAEFVGRFFNEARAAAALTHPHIIQAYDAGVTPEQIYYFAMEYVEGETLLQRIRRLGFVRTGPGLDLAIDIADALNYGWQRQRLTHGDIKPENIMINRSEECKLADFGLAKVAEHDYEGQDIMLTPLYAAPEMIRGEHAKGDCRADIYSFGATLYHLFGGSPPFPGKRAQEVMQRHLHEPLEPLRQRQAAVPQRLADLVATLLAKDPAERPADWEAVLRSLRSLRQALTEPVAPGGGVALKLSDVKRARAAATVVSRPPRRRGRWVLLSLVFTVLLAAALLGVAHLSGWRFGAASGVAAAATASGVEAAVSDDESWSDLCAAVAVTPDPTAALRRLEAFGERHAAALPADYAAVLERYRAAAAAAAPVAGAVVPAPAPAAPAVAPAAPGAEPVAEGTPGGLPPDAAVVAEPDRPAALRPPPGGAAVAALAGTVRRVSPASLPSDRIGVALPDADRHADALLAFLGYLARLEYSVPFRVEPYLEAGQRLLLEIDRDGVERSRLLFCVNTYLPALDEVLAKLVSNAEVLRGVKMPERPYQRCTVREVTLAGLVLQEQTPHGAILRNLPWARVENPVGVLLHLHRLLAGRVPTWHDRRPFLALILCTRTGKLFNEAMAGLPETPEKADWEGLRQGLEQSQGETKALRAWQRALEACQQGERTQAYASLTEVQASGGILAQRHRDLIERLLAEAGSSVPGVAGGRLVREAAELAESQPDQALGRLLMASARYGDCDFPEKSRVESLQRRALTGLALPDWLQQQARQHPNEAVVPFAFLSSTGLRTTALRAFLAGEEAAAGLPPRAAEARSLVELGALAEFGDWAAAGRLLPKFRATALAGLPLMHRAALWTAFGLVATRYGDGAASGVPEALLGCIRDQAASTHQGGYGALAQLLAIEYSLCQRRGEGDLADCLPAGTRLSPAGNESLRLRLLLAVAALAVERGQAAALPGLVMGWGQPERLESEWRAREADRAVLSACLTTSFSAPALTAALASVPMDERREGHLRLAAGAAGRAGVLDDALWEQTVEWCGTHGDAFGPVGGTALFDLLALRVACLLSAGADGDAFAAVEWSLEQRHPCLSPYYARLLFLRWGLLRLHGAGGRSELADRLDAAACANRTEKALGRVFVSDAQRDRARDASRSDPEAQFWFHWLVTCDRLGRKDGSRAPGDGPLERRLPGAERALAEVLMRRSSQVGP